MEDVRKDAREYAHSKIDLLFNIIDQSLFMAEYQFINDMSSITKEIIEVYRIKKGE